MTTTITCNYLDGSTHTFELNTILYEKMRYHTHEVNILVEARTGKPMDQIMLIGLDGERVEPGILTETDFAVMFCDPPVRKTFCITVGTAEDVRPQTHWFSLRVLQNGSNDITYLGGKKIEFMKFLKGQPYRFTPYCENNWGVVKLDYFPATNTWVRPQFATYENDCDDIRESPVTTWSVEELSDDELMTVFNECKREVEDM